MPLSFSISEEKEMKKHNFLTNTSIDAETMEEMLQKFQNHTAKILVDDENYAIINWQNSDRLEYRVRYVLEKKSGTLSVSGDFGDGIAKWYGEMEPVKLTGLLNDAYYFATKLTCSTDLYTQERADIEKDLEDLYRRMWKETHDGQMREDWYTFADEILKIEPDLLEIYPIGAPFGILSFAREYGIDEDTISTLGIRMDRRIALWALGYQMAIAQLSASSDGGAIVLAGKEG